MTRYHLSYDNPNSQFVQIKAEFETNKTDELKINLPRWRPGRYQIQDFAKRIRGFRAFTRDHQPLRFRKTNLSEWTIDSKGQQSLCIQYEYHAALMDAGNTWLDEEQLYVNPVNCLMYIEDQRQAPCEVFLDLPKNFSIATGLTQQGHRLQAPSYNILVDSPFFASASLREVKYQVAGMMYSIWFQGDMPRSDEELIGDFVPFTQKTIEILGQLPCEHYHYLNQILSYKHYHGVEHWNSTVITIGPSEALAERERYTDFLGVSCHELFHTWNVIRMRPKEMLPYDFQNPNLHVTGFITEGVTTYYGDLILARSAVFSFEEYLNELNKLLKRHFDNYGRKHYSVAESSYDLWLDGYEAGIPGRKVSIYNEGALAAMILDLMIRKKFANAKSLDNVIRKLWSKTGHDMTGYSADDYREAAESVYGEDLSTYFDEILFGHSPYESYLKPLLTDFGLVLNKSYPKNSIAQDFGFKINPDKSVIAIDPTSPSFKQLMLKDRLIETTESKGGINLTIERYGKKHHIEISKSGERYFEIYEAQLLANRNDQQKANLKHWLEACVK